MDKLKLSEKVLVARVNAGLYEYLVKYVKDKGTTISEITRQSLELFYSAVPHEVNKGIAEDKAIFDIVSELSKDFDKINMDLQAGMSAELIEKLGELHLVVMEAIEEHRRIERRLNKKIEALERINGMISGVFLEGMERFRTKVLNQFENETQLEGSSAPSSLVHCEELYQAAECER